MTKIHIILPEKEERSAIYRIGRSGVLHIQTGDEGKIEKNRLLESEEQIAMFDRAIKGLSGRDAPTGGPVRKKRERLAQLKARDIDRLLEKDRELHSTLQEVESELERIAFWGDFSRRDLRYLEKRGVSIRLFEAPEKDFHLHGEKENLYPVGRKGKQVLFAAVKEGDFSLPFGTEIHFSRDTRELRRIREKILEERFYVESELNDQVEELPELIRKREELLLRHRIALARGEFQDFEELSVLTGYIPKENLKEFRSSLESMGWGVFEGIIQPGEEVPTLIQGGPFSRLFQPVMKFLEVIPGYREFDANPVFLIFFSIFFAMLIGDAGYGLTLLVALLFFHWKKPLSREQFGLFFLLGSVTMLWGGAGGLWFGSEELVKNTPLQYLVVPQLDAFVQENNDLTIRVCFLLGLMQLSMAHIWLIFRYFPSLRFLSETGWILLLSGLYFLVQRVVLADPMGEYVPVLLGGGALLVVAFSEQQGDGVIRGIHRGLLQFPFHLMTGISSFSDLVSYIRLFAVGLATKEVAVAFNTMARQSGSDSAVAIAISVFILLFGHTINLILGAMSVLVHGVRLNFLEFSRHLGMEWSGISYRPFRTNDRI